jgi:hypothetical protein
VNDDLNASADPIKIEKFQHEREEVNVKKQKLKCKQLINPTNTITTIEKRQQARKG